MVKTAGCGSVMRGFESHYPPQKVMGYRQAVRQRILIPSCAGSNPATLANYRDPERNLRALYFQGKSSNCKGYRVWPKLKQDRKTGGQTRPVGEILGILEILQGMKCAISGSILRLIHLALMKGERSMSTTYEFYVGRKTKEGKTEAIGYSLHNVITKSCRA